MVAGCSATAPLHKEPELRYLPWLAYMVFAGLWLNLINQLRVEWSINDQYGYGFAVPILALYLFIRQWNRAAPSPQTVDSPRLRARMLAVISVFAALLLPLRLVQEANPDWRIVSWGMAAIVIAITLAMISHRAGFARARSVAFSVAFVFTAVPWPSQFEFAVIQNLTRLDISVAAALLHWLGIPALQQGNVLGVGSSCVGFDEACSGIRSLQTTLMVSLFIGELYRFAKVRRCVAIVCTVMLALLFNIARILGLAWLSAQHGNPVMERWHDSLGTSVMMALLAAVWGLCAGLHPPTPKTESFAATPSGSPTERQLWPRAFVIWLAAWIVFTESATAIWYRCHESTGTPAVAWTVRWPVGRDGFQDRPIPKSIQAILRYNEGAHRLWKDDNGSAWSAFFFRWAPGRSASVLAHSHRPEVCLPAYGRGIETDYGMRVYTVSGINFCFHHYLFRESDHQLHVWYCVRDDDTVNSNTSTWLSAPLNELNLRNRLRAVCIGRRNLGQRELEVILSGTKNAEEAETAFATLLGEIIKR